MTNREWLLDKMQNMSDEELAVFLDSPYVFLKIKRTECVSNCLKSEHKEPITLSEAERIILENIDKEYKWIARDECGDLVLHAVEPHKEYMCNTWINDEAEDDILSPFNHLFQFITWNDEQPYNIEELLKGE
jgi:hypothetical protein